MLLKHIIFFFLIRIGVSSDGIGVAINCSASSNYIMAPYNSGDKVANSFLFSSCSINTIKNKLLSANRT